jgi:hypothetical protein
VHALLISMRATRPSHLILDLIILIFGKQYSTQLWLLAMKHVETKQIF